MGKKITTIIFDYGCVLSLPQDRRLLQEISSIVTSEDVSVFEKVYYSIRPEYDLGFIDGRGYWERIFKSFGRTCDLETADKLISMDALSWIQLNNNMLDFIRELKKQDYNLAVLSNMPPEILDYIEKDTDILSMFDNTVFSCDLGLIKPDPEIYRKCLEITGSRDQGNVFIDDKDENISAAEKQGIKGVKYTGFPDFLKTMENLLN
jgi:putative hydrolase of the HAD superfamily